MTISQYLAGPQPWHRLQFRHMRTSTAALLFMGCSITDKRDDDREGSAISDLSPEAAAFFALMRWDPLSDAAAVPLLDDAPSLPATDDPADQAAIEQGVDAIASGTLESLTFSRTTGQLQASSYEFDIEPGLDLTNEDGLRDGVGLVLAGAGAAREQAHLEVTTLRATGGDIGEEPVAYDVAKTVQISRKLLGMNVSLNYGVASFAMDGRFIGIWFQWHRIDYANSVLTVPGVESEESVMVAAAQSLANRGVRLRPTVSAIDVGAYYMPRPPLDPQSDLWTLDLVGYAGLRDSNGNGMGGEGEIPGYEFYLDGSGPLLPGAE